MSNLYQIYLISDATGETLDRIFTAIKAQFKNINYKIHTYSFTRTENQILKILENAEQERNSIILYSIVDSNLAKYLAKNSDMKKIPCFGVLGDLILSFSKLLNQKATRKPSAQHVLDEDYYKRIEAIQFTMAHDDGKKSEEIDIADIILLGVSRTSKTPISIYLANRGYKTLNIPLVTKNNLPKDFEKTQKNHCIIGLFADPERLSEIRRIRASANQSIDLKNYTDVEEIKVEVENSKKLFKKYNWPIIDVTRKSVEETAASIIKTLDILNSK